MRIINTLPQVWGGKVLSGRLTSDENSVILVTVRWLA